MPTDQDLRPVVVAVDSSDSARDAAGWAADVAADWSAPLHLVHVAPPTARATPPLWLDELRARAEHSGARPCTAETRTGSIVPIVVARAAGARMVVLGSYGSDAYSGMLAGSVALGVVGGVACPVAIVRGRESRLAPPRDGPVVVGVDGSPAGVAALTFAADLATSIGSQLVAVHTWSDVAVAPSGSPIRRSGSPVELGSEASDLLADRLTTIRNRMPGLDVVAQVTEGTPVGVLIAQAEQARVLVVGTRGPNSYTGILMGSTSNALLEFAPCPVVVVHPSAIGAPACPRTAS
jgi:nucleotide-binding universal stress UspA family protein